MNGHVKVVKVLLERGACKEVKNNHELTPLHEGLFINYFINLNCLIIFIYSFRLW
jgi:ankyrin repeat protein